MTIRFLIYLILLLVAFSIGVVRYRKLTTPFKVLTIFIGVTFLSESMGRILAVKFGNSSPVYHIYNIFNYIFYTRIYAGLIKHKVARRIIAYSAIPVIIFSIINTLFIQGIFLFPSNFLLISCVANISFSLILFSQMLGEPSDQTLLSQSIFWFNVSVLFYFAIIFLNWGFFNYLLRHKFNMKPISLLLYYTNLAYYILFGFAISIDQNQKNK